MNKNSYHVLIDCKQMGQNSKTDLCISVNESN